MVLQMHQSLRDQIKNCGFCGSDPAEAMPTALSLAVQIRKDTRDPNFTVLEKKQKTNTKFLVNFESHFKGAVIQIKKILQGFWVAEFLVFFLIIIKIIFCFIFLHLQSFFKSNIK